MTDYNTNNNFVGGNVVFNGGINNFGNANVLHGPLEGEGRTSRLADVGVLTVLAEETRAVWEAFRGLSGFREYHLTEGVGTAEASLSDRSGKQVRVAAINAVTPESASIAAACRALLAHYSPAVVLMVGVAAGTSESVRLGDVVVSERVLTYDTRQEHRIEAMLGIRALLRYRINEFLARTASPRTYRIHPGTVLATIGRGDTAAVHQLLRTVNAKFLAVETEAGVVAETLLPAMRDNTDFRGWLSIRGIADHTGAEKGNPDGLRLAAEHSAEVMTRLLPFIYFNEQ